MVARYQWQFVTPAALAAPGGSASPDLRRLGQQAAGLLLYAARAGPEPARNAAYGDLRRYLARAGAGRPPPAPPAAWDDVIQEARAAVAARLAGCRAPRAFLPWALAILENQRRQTWRAPVPVSLEALQEARADYAPVARGAERDRHVDPAGDQELLRILRRCLDTDEERGMALWLMLGLKRREWGLIFASPLTHYDGLRQQVRRKLGGCPAFLRLFARLPQAA
jgi:DNA-directed RNA polymerase specialized sigma24 family protein